MANPDYAFGAFAKHNLPSRFGVRRAKIVDRDKNWELVKKLVNARDGWCCRFCRKAIDSRATTLLDAGHHHHIVRRSQGRIDETWNVCLLDSKCHDLVHVKRTLRIEGNADDGLLTFWSMDDDGCWYVLKQEDGLGGIQRD